VDTRQNKLDGFFYNDDAERCKTTAQCINGLTKFYKEFISEPSEKLLQSAMAVIKANDIQISANWDNRCFRWGMGICIESKSSPSIYLTSKEMQHLGKYEVVQKRGGNVIRLIDELDTPIDLQTPFVKDLVSAFGERDLRLGMRKELELNLKPTIDKLNNDFQALLDKKLEAELLREGPIYHLSCIMREENCQALLNRIIKESRLRRLNLNEDIKNNPKTLRDTLNKTFLHDIASEVRSGIAKIIIYRSVWEDDSNNFVSYLEQNISDIRFTPPSRQFKQHLCKLLPLLSLRRWAISYVRSKVSGTRNSPESYENQCKILIESCWTNNIDVRSLYNQFYGGVMDD
jgi:hypothetical protein